MQVPTCTTPDEITNDLVNAEQCLKVVFPQAESRPCLRTLKGWQSRRMIPYVKLGKRCFYQPSKVKAAIEKHFTINSRA